MMIPRHYEDLKIMHENTMPKRAYYIPASRRMDNLVRERTASDRLQMLNGTWKFRFYNSIYDVTERFFEKEYCIEAFDSIPVPGVWQNYGYDSHQYTNVRYPFPLDPPYVPQENPCGIYVHEFKYAKDSRAPKTFLNFEGVDSCFYAWLNGEYVGYSQVSHATSEFDVTDKLLEGNNRLTVLVLKWCDGSYLEDQDKFRMSGIFRDVYLLKRPEQCLYDYFTTTSIHENCAVVDIKANFHGAATETRVTIYGENNTPIVSGNFEQTEQEEYSHSVQLEIVNPVLWNAEQPYLYTVVYETEQEVITDRIGVREITVMDQVIHVNGKPIKFRGVNRHESDPVTGFVISLEQMEKDLQMIKAYNFNAIRTSHYPCVPYFYQLCDEYGFFVIDEADNESHGTQTQYLKDNSWEHASLIWNRRIADNPDFLPATLDRTMLCIQRDKNRPCVVIWSLGNECAYGITFEESAKWVKNFDPSRLTQFESSIYVGNDREYDLSNLDIHSRMYPTFTEIQDYLDNDASKPYLLVEYCHAMGNGPGDLEDYFELIEANDIMCGGFVWEWCDHAVYTGEAENGKAMYAYGGDSGEMVHDGNFCVDGLVYPDRRPHTGLVEYKNVYRPVRVVEYNQITGVLVLKNKMDFWNLNDYLEIHYEVTCDGVVTASGEVEMSTVVAPHEDGVFSLRVDVPEKGRSFLKLSYYLKNQTELLDAGHSLGFEEIPLYNADMRNQKATALLEEKYAENGGLEVEEQSRFLQIKGKAFTYLYNKLNGMLEQMNVQDEDLFDHSMDINIWRAPTDNDRNIKRTWMRAHYDWAVTRAYETTYDVTDTEVMIKTDISVSAPTVQRMLDIHVIWKIDASGTVSVSMSVKKDMEFPELPRFGLRLFLKKDMEQVTYYGMGPNESYVDKHQASWHGCFESKVKDMHEDYVRPQENGSHFDCEYVRVESEKYALTAVSSNPFSFNASPYTQEELTAKNHNYELVSSDSTVLCLDYAQAGIGSNSCGPELLEKYKFNEETFTFNMKLVPSIK